MNDNAEMRIIEAVPVPQAGLVWIRCSDDSTAEIATGPVATVGELMERLRYIPADTPLLTSGYEAGFTGIAALTITEDQGCAVVLLREGR
ncbi:hypothetical protein [Mycobacterium sp. 155]|uniref:hypothetical protein n=1 Tax=Mycobacterium sp. 155 TaxID=1157943 RepID=UPI00036B0D85|nr:hypothetical protein [Mycobacterium sp. 155]